MIIMWFALGGENGGLADRQRVAEHGGIWRHAVLYRAGGVVHSAAQEPAEYRAALPQPVWHSRRGRDHRHRAGDALYQIQDPNFTKGVVWVIVWFGVAIIYFALVGRNKLILSPEEEFAMSHKAKA